MFSTSTVATSSPIRDSLPPATTRLVGVLAAAGSNLLSRNNINPLSGKAIMESSKFIL